VHFAAHRARRYDYFLYSNVDKVKFVCLLPLWKWTERIVTELTPLIFEKLDKIKDKKFRVGQFLSTGLALNFVPVGFHNDCGDIAPAILSYFTGPFEKKPGYPVFFGGEFIMKCMGIQVLVNPQDNLITESRLFHEVGNVVGVRFNITSYFKNAQIMNMTIPKNGDWLFKENFGYDLEVK